NSGDTAGDKARVVGYGAFVFEEAAKARLSDTDRRELLGAAAIALDVAATAGRGIEPDSRTTESFFLSARRASFVTLKKGGKLRGCVGSVLPVRSLIDDVAANAVRAGFGDSRFPPLSRDELAALDVEVSILSHSRQMRFSDDGDLIRQLRPGIDGLILQEGDRRGLFLPAVWESLPSPVDFIAHLIQKAGLPRYYWSDSLRVFRFTTEKFGGPFDVDAVKRHRVSVTQAQHI
ncbi:MAG: AmmeMemoRadiSam system protein A, partial [Hyphomicrobiales bacterium]|nr:AmmeMemoRadiSam system protein A [Hyphomicrobiales bacterium]